MKRIHVALVAVLALGILAPMTHAATKPIKKKVISVVCPVTKSKIPDVSKSAGKSVYKGKTYYFCAKSCKLKFDKKPAKYVAAPKPVSAGCPVMGTKIPDVTKAAGKSVYKGKTYYFCCPGCKPPFDENPEKYVGTAK